MKCIAAVVMMAVALAVAEGSIVPLAYSSPLALAAPHTTVVQQNLGAPLIHAAPLAYSAIAPAISYAAHASVIPTAYVHQPAIAVLAQKEGRYVAATRGAVHDAPLAGHAISQQSLNLAPAPGTL
ncbi:adult cuticle protein 1-like [Toxorhynchites rutilus septentrionalis]|uniref:adult cuticle protein 1-like n=1 Tax=Toxorhynchites rutilus septentrionalis TaxID=329112 RepID=UPI00247A5B88|nr:adult cuticle protein 1-like [Toxorhynchites rutilus septentrionalis]XP_055645397.1 adult cuticle protein 1-like [Toxorhynchites rutilus septentrionalis]